jgi:heat shock protein HslJ
MWPSIHRAAIPAWTFVMLLAGVCLESASAQSLPGTEWNAVEISGTPVTESTTAANQPHLVFGTDGRVSGADGCNRLTGPYTVKDDAITFGQLAGTQMACANTEQLGKRFRAALRGTGRWRIEKGRLQFYDATGKPLAVFVPRPAETVPTRRE